MPFTSLACSFQGNAWTDNTVGMDGTILNVMIPADLKYVTVVGHIVDLLKSVTRRLPHGVLRRLSTTTGRENNVVVWSSVCRSWADGPHLRTI